MPPKKHSVRSHLVLDHFYIAFNPDEIFALRGLEKKIQRLSYIKTTSGTRSWSGIYLYTNIGSYFEMLGSDEYQSVAFAFSARKNEFVDGTKIRRELPNLPWQQEMVHWGNTKKIWFNSLKTKQASKSARLGAWIMQYPGLHAPEISCPTSQSSVERFTKLEVSVNSRERNSLLELKKWMPGKITVGNKTATLALPDRDLGIFQVKINFSPNQVGAKLIRLEGQTLREFRRFEIKCGKYNFQASRGLFSLQTTITPSYPKKHFV